MITRVHHVAAVVRSLEAGVAFWQDTLGLPVVREAELPDQGVRAALLACGSSEVELLEPIGPDTGVARFLAARGEGLHHLCFESDDVGRDLKRLAASDVALIDARPRPGLAGLIGFIHPRACAGVLVELATPAEPAFLPMAPLALAVVHLAVDDVRTAAAGYRNLFGLSGGLTGPDGDVAQLSVAGVTLRLAAAARTRFAPGLSALGLTSPDPRRLSAQLERRGVAGQPSGTGLVLGRAAAHGVPLVIRHTPEAGGGPA